MSNDLDNRIADAFATQMSSQHLADLLAEVNIADQDAAEASAKANETALDPATRPDDVAAARKTMEDAAFTRLRMERAAAKLEDLRIEASRREAAADRQREHAAAIVERDQLVKDLVAYEAHAIAIADLMARIKANNAKLSAGEHAEPIARGQGFEWYASYSDALPQLLENVRLPKFRRDNDFGGYLWPKQNS